MLTQRSQPTSDQTSQAEKLGPRLSGSSTLSTVALCADAEAEYLFIRGVPVFGY